MSTDKIYNAIIVDTNAFDAKNNDFCGYFGEALPAFFDAIKERKLVLLSHPVLMGETIKHIRNGNFSTKVNNAIVALGKHKFVLEKAGVSYEEIIRKLENVNMCDETIDQYKKLTKEAILLPFTNPEVVFERYFDNKPPFAESGDKKAEFPDAFVIESVREYLCENTDTSLLIVSKDGDWKKYFEGFSNIHSVDDIETALVELNQHDENLAQIVADVHSEIEASVSDVTRDVWFTIYDFECNEDELEIDNIKLLNLDERYVPLRITNDMIEIQTKVELALDGYVTVLDLDNSVWDSEDREYAIRKYAMLSFNNATASVVCEIKINISGKPVLEKVKFVSSHGVCIDVYAGEYEETPIDDEGDAYADMMDTLEYRYWH